MASTPSSADSVTLTADDGSASVVGRIADIAEGARIGRYHVLARVGVGGMGIVHEAYDPELDRRVAIKLLLPRYTGERQAVLMREAQAIAGVVHPNVITVHDVGTVGGRVYMAMELVRGVTLSAWRTGGRRGWDDVLDVMIGVGRGVAAVHAAGLVHADVKPDNVMIGDDGRVVVMDFGLVRVADGSLTGDATSSLVSGTAGTAHGPMAGTPAYMAAELHRGGVPDARSDQFAYCVALYEALYGQRPFQGETIAALVHAIQRRELAPLSQPVRVPTTLLDIVVRGLDPEPSRRWPSMTELVDALTAWRVARRRRPRWLALAAGVTATIASVVVIATTSRDPAMCSGAAAKVAEVWNDERRTALASAFAAADPTEGAATWARVDPVFDDYASTWSAAYADACEDTHVRRIQDEDAMTERTHCLATRLRAFSALLGVLADPRGEAIQRAVESAQGLPPIDRCGDPRYVASLIAQPGDPADAEAFDEARTQLARIGALVDTAQLELATIELAEVETRAASSRLEGLQPELELTSGRIAHMAARYPEAEASFESAYFHAQSLGAGEIAGRAALALARIDVMVHERHEEGIAWARHGLAEAERIGDVGLVADAHAVLALAYQRNGDASTAIVELERAAELGESAWGEDSVRYVGFLGALGNLEASMGRIGTALPRMQRALEIVRRTLGESHPTMVNVLMPLATIHARLGDEARAEAYMRQALAIVERKFGAEHALVAQGLVNVAALSLGRNDVAGAEADIRRALGVLERSFGPTHPKLVIALLNLGKVLTTRGELDEAEGHLQRALAIVETNGSAYGLSDALSALAELAVARGDAPTAMRYADRAFTTAAAEGGAWNPGTARPRLARARAHLLAGRSNAARDDFEAVVVVLGARSDMVSLWIDGRFGLARACVDDPAHHARAMDSARAALFAAKPDNPYLAHLRPPIEAWLAAHGD